MTQKQKKYQSGMSLIEILIVVAIFGILATVTTRSVLLTLRGARKSESQLTVRENLNYALSIMERQLRGAQKITTCPNPDPLVLNYQAADFIDTSFSCLALGTDGYVASGSARLTSTEVDLVSCSITCNQTNPNSPPVVRVRLEAQTVNSQAAENQVITAETEITLRNY